MTNQIVEEIMGYGKSIVLAGTDDTIASRDMKQNISKAVFRKPNSTVGLVAKNPDEFNLMERKLSTALFYKYQKDRGVSPVYPFGNVVDPGVETRLREYYWLPVSYAKQFLGTKSNNHDHILETLQHLVRCVVSTSFITGKKRPAIVNGEEALIASWLYAQVDSQTVCFAQPVKGKIVRTSGSEPGEEEGLFGDVETADAEPPKPTKAIRSPAYLGIALAPMMKAALLDAETGIDYTKVSISCLSKIRSVAVYEMYMAISRFSFGGQSERASYEKWYQLLGGRNDLDSLPEYRMWKCRVLKPSVQTAVEIYNEDENNHPVEVEIEEGPKAQGTPGYLRLIVRPGKPRAKLKGPSAKVIDINEAPSVEDRRVPTSAEESAIYDLGRTVCRKVTGNTFDLATHTINSWIRLYGRPMVHGIFLYVCELGERTDTTKVRNFEGWIDSLLLKEKNHALAAYGRWMERKKEVQSALNFQVAQEEEEKFKEKLDLDRFHEFHNLMPSHQALWDKLVEDFTLQLCSTQQNSWKRKGFSSKVFQRRFGAFLKGKEHMFYAEA